MRLPAPSAANVSADAQKQPRTGERERLRDLRSEEKGPVCVSEEAGGPLYVCVFLPRLQVRWCKGRWFNLTRVALVQPEVRGQT